MACPDLDPLKLNFENYPTAVHCEPSGFAADFRRSHSSRLGDLDKRGDF
jgi:hypothetical protein